MIVEQLPETAEVGVQRSLLSISETAVGQPWLLPVITITAPLAGPKVVVTAGLHGDEFHGSLLAQQLARELPTALECGSVTILPSLNISGALAGTRDFLQSDQDASTENLNRLFPGKADGNAAQRFVQRLWQQLTRLNANYALDLHSQSRGASYPLMAFADMDRPAVIAMVKTLGVDVIQHDSGAAGVLESQWLSQGVTALTLEVGGGSALSPQLLQRGFDGVMNWLRSLEMVAGVEHHFSMPLVGHQTETIRAEFGGTVLPQAELGQQLEAGQLVAIQYDQFGAERRRYHTPVAGYLLSLLDTPLREPGAMIARILY